MPDRIAISFEEISQQHDVSGFTCGQPTLDDFLRKNAKNHPRQGLSRTWVVLKETVVVAYYTLSFASVSHASATTRVSKGMPRHDLPVLLLARLAVDQSLQGQGLGSVVLEHAMRRCLQMADAAQTVGAVTLPVRAVLVQAIDAKAAAFYEKYGFDRSPTDPLHLMMLVKDMRKTFG